MENTSVAKFLFQLVPAFHVIVLPAPGETLAPISPVSPFVARTTPLLVTTSEIGAVLDTSLTMSYVITTVLAPICWAATTLVILNEVCQFQVIDDTSPVRAMLAVMFVVPAAGTDPVPVQPVHRQLTPATSDVRATEQVTDDPHA